MKEISTENNYRHRLGEKSIRVISKDGIALKDKEVTVSQKDHRFLFGCSEFSCVALANGELDMREQKMAEKRFELFSSLFNSVTLPFYWGRFEPAKGEPLTKKLRKAAEWLKSKEFIVKGHPLCWHTVTAPWLLEMTNKGILQTQINRIRRDVSDFAGLIDMWDVVNEAVIMPIFNKYDNGITRICKDLGRIRLIREMFHAAKKANPDAILLLNDFETGEAYDILIEGCLEAGIPIDAIGIQSHMHQGYWGAEKTQEILERFSRFGLPIHFTETTLVSGHIMPRHIVDLNDYKADEWTSTSEGEARQSEEAVLHYKTLFAHPMVESITWWGFVDGGWLNAPAGFIRKDGSPKPMYEKLHNLIKNEWWTKPASYVTDDRGMINVSGYLGKYSLSCEGKTREFVLGKSGNTETVEI